MLKNSRRVLRCMIVNWMMLGLLAICSALLYALAPIRLEASPFATATGLLLLICAIGGHWLFRRERHRTGLCLIAVSQIAILATIGAMASLPIAALTHGYADAMLAQADLAIGLNWRSYVQFAIDHPAFRNMLKISYFMFVPETFLMVISMSCRGHGARVAIFVSASICAIALALAGFWLAPAVGTYLQYGASQTISANFGVNPYEMAAPIALARSGTMVAHFDALLGLISIPSMHTAGALLVLWLGWRERWLRPAILPLNLAMIAATPIDGSHYFVDVIAGGMTAIVSLAAAAWLAGKTRAEAPVSHSPRQEVLSATT